MLSLTEVLGAETSSHAQPCAEYHVTPNRPHQFAGNQLNEILGAMVSTNIPHLPHGSKRISLAAAFKELYKRPSITALQRKITNKGKG